MADARPGRAVRLVVVLFVLNGVLIGVFLPFGSAILAGRGFSATQIGFMGAVVSLGYVGLAGAWGHLADVVLGRARALALAIAVAAGLLVVFALPLPFVAVGIAYMGFSMVCGLVFPLQDALAVNTLPDPARQYGPVRGVESGAFAVATLVAGVGYGQLGYVAAVPLFAVLAVPSMVAALRLPDVARAKLAGRARGGAIREALAVQPRLPRLLLAIGLANVGVFAGLTFLPLLITRLGGGPGQIGLAVGITAVVEVVAMPVESRLIASFGPRAVVVTSFVLLGVVFAWFAVASSPTQVVAASVLYGVAWSGMWIGSVSTIRVLLPPTLQGSGQSLLSLTTAGAAAFIANVGGGLLWAGPGPAAVFGIAAACAVAGAVVGWWSVPRGGETVSVPGPAPRPAAGPAGA